jgi:hypothetical protein
VGQRRWPRVLEAVIGGIAGVTLTPAMPDPRKEGNGERRFRIRREVQWDATPDSPVVRARRLSGLLLETQFA